MDYCFCGFSFFYSVSYNFLIYKYIAKTIFVNFLQKILGTYPNSLAKELS
ncbi:conserved hypothetical protein (plasmid) [Borreliella burgdorferi WI91-23]|nr:conserved hypothetical protein [Borreliella burgdorferi WI91-23]